MNKNDLILEKILISDFDFVLAKLHEYIVNPDFNFVLSEKVSNSFDNMSIERRTYEKKYENKNIGIFINLVIVNWQYENYISATITSVESDEVEENKKLIEDKKSIGKYFKKIISTL